MEKAKAGRKSKYHTNIEPNLEQIRIYRQKGISEENIAKTYKVGYSTFRTYKELFPAFAAALQEDNEFLLDKTIKSSYETAWGYTQPQFKEVWELDRRTGEMICVKREVMPDKIILGNPTAQKFLLTNLDPANWSDRREYINNNEDNNKLVEQIDKLIDSMTDDK